MQQKIWKFVVSYTCDTSPSQRILCYWVNAVFTWGHIKTIRECELWKWLSFRFPSFVRSLFLTIFLYVLLWDDSDFQYMSQYVIKPILCGPSHLVLFNATEKFHLVCALEHLIWMVPTETKNPGVPIHSCFQNLITLKQTSMQFCFRQTASFVS